MSRNLCVAYAADDNYAKYFGISVLSLFKSNIGFDDINVYLLDCGISEDSKLKLDEIAKDYNRHIHYILAEDLIKNLNLNMGSRKIAIASYARLFLSLIIPKSYSRILYLDCDTIVMDSLEKFWNTSLKDYHVVGVRDTVDTYFYKKIGLKENEYYVNAGILLINLQRWREDNIHEEFIKMIEKYDGNIPHHDQGVINSICRDKKIIHPRYNMTSNLFSFTNKTIKNIYFMDNYYSQKVLNEAKENPAILHFTTGLYGRPWEENCSHPMKEAYTRVAKESPWQSDILQSDSRSILVKVFGIMYKYLPKKIIESTYKFTTWIIHIKE